MSPTVFLEGGYRFFFFSREQPRLHVHVIGHGGEAKFWLDPQIELAQGHGLNTRRVSRLQRMVEEHQDEIREAWNRHFGG